MSSNDEKWLDYGLFKQALIVDTAQEIQLAVSQLSEDELACFREWFDRYDAEVWDRQFEEDAKSGKLNRFANQAIADFRSGKCKRW